ncbi:MAG: hypothetical protein OXU71_03360 [Gammaproteobacteria bacterium]|nr:hypothetical protein [Gammaproteobacteria bacterium]
MTVKHRGLVFILDGLGDRPSAALGGRTPLQAADTPRLDRLARLGCGLMDPLTPGKTVDTHTGVGMLFGLTAAAGARLRRGPVEAAGVGMDAQPGDIFLRANFAHVEEIAGAGAGAAAGRLRIIDRRAGRIREGVDELCAALHALEVGDGRDRITAALHPATQHRAVARLRGRGCELSAQVTDTDPGGDAIARGVLAAAPRDSADAAAAPAAQRTADAINRLTARAFEILRAHPLNAARAARGLPVANGLILRSAGAHQKLRSRLTARGLKVAVVAGETTVLGLGKLLGFHARSDPRFTSLPDTDLSAKLRAATDALASHDLVFVHIKGTDTAAHDRNPRLKSAFIARFDRALAALDLPRTVIGVCADHATDSNTGEHNPDPVPVLLAVPGDGDDGDGAGDGVGDDTDGDGAGDSNVDRGDGRDGVDDDGDGAGDDGASDGAGDDGVSGDDSAPGYNETDCATGPLGRITAETYLDRVLDALGTA